MRSPVSIVLFAITRLNTREQVRVRLLKNVIITIFKAFYDTSWSAIANSKAEIRWAPRDNFFTKSDANEWSSSEEVANRTKLEFY